MLVKDFTFGDAYFDDILLQCKILSQRLPCSQKLQRDDAVYILSCEEDSSIFYLSQSYGQPQFMPDILREAQVLR